MAQNAVVGYSISYPMGVLGTMIGLALVQRIFRPDYQAEAQVLSKEYPLGQNIVNYTIKITKPEVTGIRLRDLKKQFKTNVIFGRTKQADHLGLSHAETIFHVDDEVTVVGDEHEVERIRELFGEKAEEHLADDRSVLDIKRMFVSNKNIAGKTIRDLNLQDNFSAVITRVQRGDSDMLATPHTVLELGDRVRVVAERKDIKEVQTLFGDSYDSLSHIDLLSFGLGMGLGFLLGSMQMSIPIININFSLGAAGGPLVAGLVLSAIRRSGPVLWNIPYSANLMLRQVGLMLMLAAIGINSGHKFILTMQTSIGPLLFLSGAVISVLGTVIAATVAFKLLKIPMSLTLGMLSHHPALLDYAANSTGNKIPSFGYALVMPLLLIGKIIFAQLLWQMLQAMS
jgi:putative transport protein